jgi:integrase
MPKRLPKFRNFDDPTRNSPYGWDYGHGKDRKYPTFKTKKEKQGFKKQYEAAFFNDHHALVNFDAEKWREYKALEERLGEHTVADAVDFFMQDGDARKGEVPYLSEMLSERLIDLQRIGSASYGHAKLYGEKFIACAGDKPTNMYTREDVQGRIDNLAKGGASRNTCKGNLNQIKALFSNALKDGHVDRSPAVRITLPTSRGEKRLELIDPDDLRRLLEYAWIEDRTMAGLLAVLFFTGMRISMIAVPPRKLRKKEFLRLDMIDRANKSIVIPEGIMKRESLHIIDDAPECLWGWLVDLKPSDFGMQQTPFNVRKNKLLKAIGLKWPPNLHRRSFGSYLAALKGRDYAAQIMADKSESVFVKHYQVPAFKSVARKYVSILPLP